MKILFIYLAAINVFTFLLYGIDKLLAKKHWRRISERTLIMWALLGGSVGASFGMEMFRHKTKHNKFRIGLPLILLFHIIIAIVLFLYGDDIYGKLFLHLSELRFSSLNSRILG